MWRQRRTRATHSSCVCCMYARVCRTRSCECACAFSCTHVCAPMRTRTSHSRSAQFCLRLPMHACVCAYAHSHVALAQRTVHANMYSVYRWECAHVSSCAILFLQAPSAAMAMFAAVSVARGGHHTFMGTKFACQKAYDSNLVHLLKQLAAKKWLACLHWSRHSSYNSGRVLALCPATPASKPP